MAMENGPFIVDVPFKTSIHRGFSIAVFDCQRVLLVLIQGYEYSTGWLLQKTWIHHEIRVPFGKH